MTDNAKSYLEVVAEKEQRRVANELTAAAALRYIAILDQIWNQLDEDERADVEAELAERG